MAGAGIAAYMKNQKKSETQSHYIESNAIVDNSKAGKAVENFLKGMTRQSTAIGGMVITSFIEQAIEPINRQISDQDSLIKNINDDDIINSWMEHCSHVNNEVSFHDGNNKIHGTFLGINSEGAAIIKNNDRLNYYSSGVIEQ